MSFGPRLTPALNCHICGQLLDEERQRADATDVALFGAAPFAYCLACCRIVEPPWTADYQRRWTERLEELREGRAQRLAKAWSDGVLAAEGGESFSVCPPPVGAERDAWAEGWKFIWRGGKHAEAAEAFRAWFTANLHRPNRPSP